ncbi:septation ring formation regulator EzrA [Alkalibacterium putridalgicola]|uniref:Septation ring formation regulator EzrA n=1 Tax=Alkalibacterium putridalgicola TaxID=426703 RepID=A0A1H7QCA0_9LACT|nr:septation ring formation regulator EzrA [Alkalibacterium putridalgicola]GEK87963.1 septation ring formation regulator EzrA [Alkalibacterium putridalgicola]SEL45593.1 septation ring formation regulator [Alkalibacterium putridalgicola]
MTVELIITLSIVILAILIYTVTYFIRKKHYERIDELDRIKKELYSKMPSDKIRTLDKMMITGQSKEVADSVIADVNIIEGKNLPAVESHLFDAEQATDRYRFNQSTKSEQKAEELLKETEENILLTSEKMDELLQREQANLRKIDSIKKRYHKVRKELLAKSFTFGESINSLEDRLGVMENLFTSFSDLTASGDHEEAKKVVNQLESRLTEMEAMIVSIPELNSKIENDYEKQLEEIKEGYEKLIEQDYIFPESFDIEEHISQLSTKIVQLKGLLAQLELEEIESEQANVEQIIDELYDAMEKEINAKYSLEKLLRKLPKIIYYVTNQSKELSLEIDRIGQSYQLYQGEQETYGEMNNAMQEQKNVVASLTEQIEKNSIAYSDAEELLLQAFSQLENLSHSYDTLSESLYAYRDKEKEIKKDLEEMEHALREMKRYIQGKHLPGLPDDYLDLFFYTTDHLEQLSVELARPRLDLEEVTRLHALSDEDIEHLADKTEETVDNALLTELTSQRLYRYKEDYPGVMETIKYSEALFLDEYNYETSLKMVREKLESIEPGAFEEVKSLYKKEMSNAQ